MSSATLLSFKQVNAVVMPDGWWLVGVHGVQDADGEGFGGEG